MGSLAPYPLGAIGGLLMVAAGSELDEYGAAIRPHIWWTGAAFVALAAVLLCWMALYEDD